MGLLSPGSGSPDPAARPRRFVTRRDGTRPPGSAPGAGGVHPEPEHLPDPGPGPSRPRRGTAFPESAVRRETVPVPIEAAAGVRPPAGDRGLRPLPSADRDPLGARKRRAGNRACRDLRRQRRSAGGCSGTGRRGKPRRGFGPAPETRLERRREPPGPGAGPRGPGTRQRRSAGRKPAIRA